MFRFTIIPNKNMSIDNLRIAILNYLISQQYQNKFYICINDIDKNRVIDGKDTEIMQILEKFALKYSNVYHQSEKKNIYQTLAIHLLEESKAFICTCNDIKCHNRCIDKSKKELIDIKNSKKEFSIHIKYEDESDKSFIILNKDTTPSYEFASACDDMFNGIDFIIENNNFKSYEKRYEYIKSLLGYQAKTQYRYIPEISYKGNKEYTLQKLFEDGYLPDAIINYMLLLGYKDIKENIFTLPEAIEWFKFENISQESHIFDINILRSLNQEHIKMLDNKLLSTLFNFADQDIGKLAKIYLRNDISTIKELKSKIEPIFMPKDFNSKWKIQMRILEKVILEAPILNEYNNFIDYLLEKSKLEENEFFKPLRVLLTGMEDGPELSEIYPLIKSYILEIAS